MNLDLAPGTLPILLFFALLSHGIAVFGGYRFCQQRQRRTSGTITLDPARRRWAGTNHKTQLP